MNLNAQSSSFDGRLPAEAMPDVVPTARSAEHPLGPLLTVRPVEHPLSGRLYAVGVTAVAMVLLITAAWLRPDPGSVGTHRQLGLPPCGFYSMTGLPCPTCGMTTAYALAVRGRITQAIRAQAAGFILCVATVATAILGLFTGFTGRRICVNWYRVSPTTLVWLISLGFLAAWGLKIGLELLNRSERVG